MNVLFLMIDNIDAFKRRSIYMDLANKFISEGHFVTILSVCEKRNKTKEMDVHIRENNGEIIRVVAPNVTKVSNYFKKGVSLLLLGKIMRKHVKKVTSLRKYDLVLYGSPPVTFSSAISFIKRKQNPYTYLLLKDIWPYDLVFDNVLKTNGIKGIAFNYLKKIARKLYAYSDTIGCMSPANIKFLMEKEPSLDCSKIEINPNSVMPFGKALTIHEKAIIRKQYGIPLDKIVFIYGGSLGYPQGLDFALTAIKKSEIVEQAFFVIAGGGTAKSLVSEQQEKGDFKNLLFLDTLNKDDYEQLVYACDVGLIFLNHSCLAPNYPSRLLSYMQAGLPVLCATDICSDVGKIAESNEYGFWCESNDVNEFESLVERLISSNIRTKMGKKSKLFFVENYTVDNSYRIIIERMRKK